MDNKVGTEIADSPNKGGQYNRHIAGKQCKINI